MSDLDNMKDSDSEQRPETFPIEPRYHPVNRIIRAVYDFLASARLAMFLLVVILVCCVGGVTVLRDKQAWDTIFTTLWFNGLLVLLVVNVACCFFGRIWGRRVTLISLGMILFHLSFVTMFAGIIYNSLFYFRGSIRLTEGETLPSGDPKSYDVIDKGRFFTLSKLKGDTALVRMHTGYKADGKDKRAAYEIKVGSDPLKKTGIIFITHNLEYRGFKYFPDKEGYSLLTILYDNQGQELYGAYLPLQSLKKNDNNSILYTTGTKDGPTVMNFPQEPVTPLLGLNVSYLPDPKTERGGDAFFEVYPLLNPNATEGIKPVVAGKAAVGKTFEAGDYSLSVKEVRYWVMMAVRYEPGQPVVLTSLWVGLFGVVLTTLARIFKKRTLIATAATSLSR